MRKQYWNLIKTIWRFVEGKRGKYIFTYSLFVIANLIIMIQPYVLGKFLNVIQVGGENVIKNSAILLGIYAFLSFLFWVFHGPARCMERVLSFQIVKNFLDSMFRTITEIPLKWHKDHHSGQTIDKVNKASNSLRIFTEETYVYIESIIPLIVSFVAVIWIIKGLGAFILLFAIMAMILILKFDKFLIATQKEINHRGHDAASTLFDYISNITTVITLRLEKLSKNEYVKKIQHVFPIYKKNVVANEYKWFGVAMIVSLAQFSIILFYVYKTYRIDEVIMIGNLMMLYRYVDRFTNVFFGIAWKYEMLMKTSTDLTAVEDILEAHKKLFVKTKSKLLGKWKNIQIKDLNFRYEDAEHHVHTLKNINLDLQKGKKIALVGESGSGKSTLMTIIRGLQDADSSQIFIDGKVFSQSKVLSQTTTLIPQEPEIFENSIEYNISVGLRHKKKDILDAVKLACFDGVLKRLSKGLKTSIKEKGVNLSGGEKQRLALARGIFVSKKSAIILLDEPTSSVDSGNELKIYKNLFSHFKKKCVISSIHRLHLLDLFDEIYVMEKGKIVEQGDFQTLIGKKNGVLKKQWMNYEKNKKNSK